MFERLQELKGTAGGQEERIAIQEVAEKVVEIKTTKLGFPRLPGTENR